MSPTCPSLPLELEREIFEIAATHYPQTMPALLLVAQRVLRWIEPLLYRTLVMGREGCRLDPTALLHIQPATLKHVQNLLVWGTFTCRSDLLRVLPLCGGVQRLAFFETASAPPVLPALEKMQLPVQYLSLITTSALDLLDPTRPLFRMLTHLDMIDGVAEGPLDFNFAELPALTHLSMHGDRRPPFFFALLVSCPRLHVLVSKIWIWTSWHRRRAHQSTDVDPRFVMMFLRALPNLWVDDWKVGATGGNDFWARAELFIDKRRRGEIEPASRFWIEDSDIE
ncbi:hypothetical protein C8J57DRAFT_1369050 [Mycena rebaudengoi]|nr:hypothetical protein C8J57DRAFT_1369050 [Mycena rebaudengoi]